MSDHSADTAPASDDLTLTLSRPIPAHGEMISVLTFREPTGGDILQVGNPVIVDMASDPPRVTHDERKMTAMLSRLASVPPSSIAKLGPNEWVEAAWIITPFFMPRPGRI